jgi:hypothetical protein
MKLIRMYNFAKAQNPQSGGSTKIKIGMATVKYHAPHYQKNKLLNYVKLN